MIIIKYTMSEIETTTNSFNIYCALFNVCSIFAIFFWNVYILNKSSSKYQLLESSSESESESDNCVITTIDYTNKMKRFSHKIHKTKEFDDIFQEYKSYNKSKKEGKKFTYNYFVRNAVIINKEDREYFILTGKYYNNNLSFIFGTNEYYDDNNYNGSVLYCGNPMTLDEFITEINFEYIDKISLCGILNLYYDVFDGFKDRAFWHYK